MTEAWLIRHAETEWSKAKRHTGRTDIPLTDDGRAAATVLADRLAGREWGAVWCSPLSRARETCALAGLGDRAVLRDELLEWDYGDYEGVTTAAIREARPDWYLWRDGCPGGESPADVAARCDRLVAGLLEVDGDVALFAHGHLLRMLAARWIELAPDGGGRLALSTGSLSVLGFERETRVLWRWNQNAT
ncbi:MAG: histidine phosphatase family protein [Solirubrobacterales bacterium]|nr:histidine phosphatase family protein [Solirubrobacterales bacterium]